MRVAGVLAAVLWAAAWTPVDTQGAATQQKPVVPPPVNEAQSLTGPDGQALADFTQRTARYAELHQRLEATLPALPKETTPQVIETHQRAFEKLMRAERRDAKQGSILTSATRRVFRQILARVFSGKDGPALRAAILDDNPGKVALTVNSRYPDNLPVSTVPPQVLASLPKLPAELEYRFIGDRLILLDIHAHTVADYMDNAFPR